MAQDSTPNDNELQLNGNPTNNNGNTNNQVQPTNELAPPVDDGESDDTYEQGNQQFHILPFQFFQRRDPISSIFEALRRHRMDLDQQFSQLERQAGEGQDISYFYRNGVQYIRTCVTKRVQPQDQPQVQPQVKPSETS